MKLWTRITKNIKLLSLTMLIAYQGHCQLSGTYIIDPSGNGDYTTLQLALSALTSGVSGAVVFKMVPGKYSRFSASAIPSTTGASLTNTITFESIDNNLDSVKIVPQFASNRIPLDFSGNGYFIFKNITIESFNAPLPLTDYVIKGGNNNQYINCKIDGNTLNAIIDIDSNNQIMNCNIPNGRVVPGFGCVVKNSIVGARFDLNYNNVIISNNILKAKTPTSVINLSASTNSIISNNEIWGDSIFSTSFSRAAINASAFTREDSLIITGNTIHYGSYGIYMGGVSFGGNEKSVQIKNNHIIQPHYKGIFAKKQEHITIYGNQIESDTAIVGIEINTCTGSIKKGLIANNFISLGNGSNLLQGGIRASFASNYNIYHNTINILSKNAISSGLGLLGNSGFNLVNNIIANTGGGYTIDAQFTTTELDTSNYNDLYTTGTNIARWGGSNYTNLTAFQLGSSKDNNSISIDPLFTSATNLHVCELALDSAGTPLGVGFDIDSQTRSLLFPDIGADEFTKNEITLFDLGNDTGICSGNSVVLQVDYPGGIYNWSTGDSSQTIIADSGLYYVNVSNACQSVTDSIIITENQLPVVNLGKDTSVCNQHILDPGFSKNNVFLLWSTGDTTETLTVTTSNTYSVMVTDSNSCSNIDSIMITIFALPTFTISTDTTPNICNGDTLSITVNTTDSVQYLWTPNSGLSCTNCPQLTASPTTSTTYYLTATDSNGCSTMDSLSIVVNTCIGISEKVQDVLAIYPNPTTGIINISGLAQSTTYELKDLSGKKIQFGNLNPLQQIDIRQIPQGIYFLLIRSKDDVNRYKVIKL